VKRVLPVMMLSACLVLVAQVPALAWTVAVVDSNDGDGLHTTLAVSNSDKTYVAYVRTGSDDLWWALWKGTSWKKTQVAGAGTTSTCYGSDNGGRMAAGFAPDGTARIISTCEQSSSKGSAILWTYRDTGTNAWVTQKIGSAPPSDKQICVNNQIWTIDLAFDPDTGYPSIVYTTTGTLGVYWLHWTGSAWQNDPLAVLGDANHGCTPTGPSASIAFASDGAPAIAWVQGDWIGPLKYSKYSDASSSWSTGQVGTLTDAHDPSLAFSSDGIARIAFTRGLSPSYVALARKSGTSWKLSRPDPGSGGSPSLAFSGTLARIAYDGPNGVLKYAAYDGASWTLTTLDSTDIPAQYPCLDLTSTGAPRISFLDVAHKDVRWARN